MSDAQFDIVNSCIVSEKLFDAYLTKIKRDKCNDNVYLCCICSFLIFPSFICIGIRISMKLYLLFNFVPKSMSAPTPASSSIITTANIASTNEDDDNENIQVDKWPSVNDVVAVKSNEYANCDSFVRIINDVKEKTELVLNMESKIESMLEKIILTDDHSELINELVNDKSIELNKMMSCILNHISNIQNQIHIQQLAQIIARQCFKKKSLGDIGPYVNSMIDNEENSLKKTFIKKVLMEISRLTRQNKPVGYDPIVDDFLGLSSIVMSWTLQRIAIIGAGAAGSSAAFFLNKQLSILACRDKVEITIYEKETRVGGRAAIIHPYNDPKYNPVEIGASIYASVNLHLKRAIEQFNLSPKFLDIDNTHNTYLYNGKTVLVDMDDPTTRYNPVSLMRMNSLAQATVQRFLQLYQRRFQLLKGPFRTVEAYAKAIDLEPRVNESGFEFLTRNGLDTMIVNELVDSTTQGTYGQQVTQLHAVMTFVAMVGRGNSIVGGNYQIFGM
ncbi:unnamed protein product [Rotaria magnacalcarata]|uniref:Prenylcysteine lyase domain-containing protein n=1 Tax=Rotaria magnacalcarata TaxID=392030 RepID=A0A819UV22_9BILA|nr:unnamed protein product [Rotaria magnacalcarata]